MNTVLFDLDGTLLPMDEDRFTKAYFKELCKKVAPLGMRPEPFVDAVWAGTKAMVLNDGTVLNKRRFWDRFMERIPCEREEICRVCDEFYANEFHNVRGATGSATRVKEMIGGLRQKGYTVALATNPIFPDVAVRTRLSWIGLAPEDFALCTSYDNSHFTKPNLKYYQEILEKLGKKPEDCLMIGNNVREDMCFAELGGSVFLLTDCLQNPKNAPVDLFPHGDMAALEALLEALPGVGER